MSDSFANIGRICITHLHIIGLNNNRIIGLNLNVTILNSLQLKY